MDLRELLETNTLTDISFHVIDNRVSAEEAWCTERPVRVFKGHRCILALRSAVFNELFSSAETSAASNMVIGNLTDPAAFGCFRDGLYDSRFTMATFAPYLTSAATQAESYVNTERTIDHQQSKFQDLLVDCVNLCQEYQVLSAINGSALTLLRNFLQRHPDRLWEILTKIRVCCYDWLGDLRQSNILADTLKAPGVELMPLNLLLLFVEHAWRNEQRVQLALLLRWISYRMADTERPAYATEKQIRDAWEYIFRSGLWEHTDILTGVAIRRDRGRTESTTIGGEMTATQSDYTIIAESLPAEQPPNISSLDLSAGEIVVEQVDESGKVPAIPAVGAAAITVVKQPTAGRKLSKIADQFHIIKLGFERG